MAKRGLGKKQKAIVDALKADHDRFIQIVYDYRDLSEDITLSDEGNDYCKLYGNMFRSLRDRGLLIEVYFFEPSIDITIQRFKLK
jgi:hypothetical protein